MTLRVAVLGASGRMGRQVIRQLHDADDAQLVAAFTHPASARLGADAGELAGVDRAGVPLAVLDRPVDADVLIDFALPAGLAAALPHLGTTPLVSGTTGAPPELLRALDDLPGPWLLASNFSTGVNVLTALVAAAAAAVPDFDIEIVEAHHRRKVDAPSGTALTLARAAAAARDQEFARHRVDGRSGSTGPRPSGEIGLHALRGGSITGHHTAWLAGPGERLQLTHEAEDRSVFARGALRAARWIVDRPAHRYTMHDVLGLSGMLRAPDEGASGIG